MSRLAKLQHTSHYLGMIVISPYDGIKTALDRYSPTSVISILDQGEQPPEMTGIAPNQHLKLSLSMASAEMTAPACPQQEDERIRRLISFAGKVDWTHALLIHCRLGLSRSPGAAFIIQCALSPDRDEALFAEELRIYSERVEPSLMMVAKADEMLGRDGRMIDAIDNIGIGSQCMAGEIFQIPYLPEQHQKAS